MKILIAGSRGIAEFDLEPLIRDGVSKGSEYTVRYAQKRGKPIRLLKI